MLRNISLSEAEIDFLLQLLQTKALATAMPNCVTGMTYPTLKKLRNKLRHIQKEYDTCKKELIPNILEKRVSALEIPAVTAGILYGNDVKCVKDLVAMSTLDLYRMPWIAHGRVVEIQHALAKHGLHLADEKPKKGGKEA